MLPAPMCGGQAQHTFKGVSFRGLLRPDNFDATGLTQGPCSGTKVKRSTEKKDIWFSPSSTGGSQGNNELSSIIMTLTIGEYRKQGTSHRQIFPLVFCFGQQQPINSEDSQVAVFTNHQ